MHKPLIFALGVGIASVGLAGATLAQAAGTNPAADQAEAPAVLSQPRSEADAVAPELAAKPPRAGGPVLAESRLAYRDGNRTLWLTPSVSGGVCVVAFISGATSFGGANCIDLDQLKEAPVFRLHSISGDVDVALTADGAATEVAAAKGGRVLATNLVAVPTAPLE